MVKVVMAILTALAWGTAAGESVWAEPLTIGAAYSMKPGFQEIVPMFEREHGATVEIVYGPSHILRQRIERGESFDVFLSEGLDDVEKLYKKGLTLDGRPKVYAQTSLVLVASTFSRATPASFRDEIPNRSTRLALGDPRTSVLGDVTDRALIKADAAYKNRFRILHARQNQDILQLVHTGEADLGIVYRVDAINSGQVRIIDETPAGTSTHVPFGEAVVWTCQGTSIHLAEEFVRFMMSPRIQKLLLKHGMDSVPLKGGGE